MLYAFDLLEHDGDDLCELPLIERKHRLAQLLGTTKRQTIQFVEHLTEDDPNVFKHVCRMGLEGIVSKRVDSPYRSGRPRRGSSRRTRRARRCGGNVKRIGVNLGQSPKSKIERRRSGLRLR